MEADSEIWVYDLSAYAFNVCGGVRSTFPFEGVQTKDKVFIGVNELADDVWFAKPQSHICQPLCIGVIAIKQTQKEWENNCHPAKDVRI